jgi:hypothetical protein
MSDLWDDLWQPLENVALDAYFGLAGYWGELARGGSGANGFNDQFDQANYPMTDVDPFTGYYAEDPLTGELDLTTIHFFGASPFATVGDEDPSMSPLNNGEAANPFDPPGPEDTSQAVAKNDGQPNVDPYNSWIYDIKIPGGMPIFPTQNYSEYLLVPSTPDSSTATAQPAPSITPSPVTSPGPTTAGIPPAILAAGSYNPTVFDSAELGNINDVLSGSDWGTLLGGSQLNANPGNPPLVSNSPPTTPSPATPAFAANTGVSAAPNVPDTSQTPQTPRDFWTNWLGDPTQTEWAIPAPDTRLIQPITHYDSGNQALNFVLNKGVIPWRNLLGSIENVVIVPFLGLSDLDRDLKQNPYIGGTYQAATDMAPLNTSIGLSAEIGPALEYATGWASSEFSRLGPLAGQAAGNELPSLGRELGSIGPELDQSLAPTGPSFGGLIDTGEFESNPEIVDRLSRARQFDIGGYRSLTGRGEFGRVGDNLDSDEVLQNAYIRLIKNVDRASEVTRNNPAIALSPELHGLIQNLKAPELLGLTPDEVLQYHLQQMRDFTPDYILHILDREAQLYIQRTF